MFTSLVLGTALASPAAPVPADSAMNPAGPAPRVVYLKGDANGNVTIYGYTIQKVRQTRQRVEIVNGQQIVKQEQVELPQQMYFQRQLAESGAKLTTAEGTELSAADAVNRVKGGAAVLISADGKPVERAWLRAVAPDTVVVTSQVLANAVVMPQGVNLPTSAAPRLVLLAADADGKVTLAYNPVHNDQHGSYDEQVFINRAGGGVMVVNGRAQRMVFDTPAGAPLGQTEFPGKSLDDVKFDAYDLKGNAVARGEAVKRLRAGGFVLIAGDGKLPDAEYLKPFQGDLLVLVSSELILPPGATVKPAGGVRAIGGVAAPALAPAPVPAAVPLPAGVPARPVLLARPVAGARVLPVQPAQEDKAEQAPAPKPVEKPAAPKKD